MSVLRLAVLALAALALLAAGLLHTLRRRRARLSVASRFFTVIDTDTASSGTLLRDARLGLCGKPDYLLEGDAAGRRVLVPLEVKPTRRSVRLYDSDRIQIGAYLVALRGSFPERASRLGLVEYADRTFEVVLTPDFAAEIDELVGDVRRARGAPTVHRSHNVRAKCVACPVRSRCDESLA